MTMSMYSSYTPEDFNNIEEDIFGECEKTCRFFESQYMLVQLCPIDWASYLFHFILQIYKYLSHHQEFTACYKA